MLEAPRALQGLGMSLLGAPGVQGTWQTPHPRA